MPTPINIRRPLQVLSLLLLLIPSMGRTGDAIVVGVPTATGFLEGKACLRAVQMAAEAINTRGGITVGTQKRPLVIEPLDIRDAAPGVPVAEALLGMEKLILETRPAALLVGPYRSETLIAAMDLIARYKTPMLATLAMSPAFEDKIKARPDAYRYLFRTCPNARFLVDNLAGVMDLIKRTFGFKRVFILNQEVAWARSAADALRNTYFEKAGWEIVDQRSYPTGAGDFSSTLMKVRATGAQVILPIFDMPQSGILVKQWHTMRVPALLAGFISPLAGPASWKTFNGQITGAINCNVELGSAIASPTMPASAAFQKAYQRRWEKPLRAGHGPAPAYESVFILADAITRAGTLDADAIVAALEQTDRSGMMGRMRFNDRHQLVYGRAPDTTAVAAVFQWQADGRRRIVFPPRIAEGKIELPDGLAPVNTCRRPARITVKGT
ncbi:ABC transporter substrate-binding protein [Desulfosarcina ovata]|uniref:Branched chain amino acid ABC transporter substrate-binding protein n=1 Tax=Desulfosarcina ovata subsp. ovata TaxID=2752305 RepID=A0A5K8AKA6_9BACT|nr:ABC transporter substrate-binding protein [Desulfosarcina ovata]BBO93157.1 branched chain amino acid ABC transporter substrate-binding protein [Desulfosarcina ovata subsp. ovata]